MSDKSKIYIIADTHFGDNNIRIYENRPFPDTDELDRAMIRRWNETVAEQDIVYHLGDFGADDDARCREILGALHGHKRLVMGNHDMGRTPGEWRALGFEECYDMPILYKDWFLLSHAPLYISRSMPYANIFGHVHGMPLYRSFGPQSACISVERTDYRPVLFDDLQRRIREEAQ